MTNILKCGRRSLPLDRSHVMGVLNVTPDSFSDGGRFNTLDAAVRQASNMVEAGASLVDVGGESTRPGAAKVGLQEEMDRVCPVVEKLVSELDVVVSVDTSTPELMAEVIRLGCGMINDVRAFARPGALDAIQGADVALCMMHMQGEPATMQQAPSYASVVEELIAFFGSRIEVLEQNGIDTSHLVLDPGFGFGKTLEHNLTLLRELHEFGVFGKPLLAGLSRKSMIGAILEKDVEHRLYGSVAAAVIAVQHGAHIVRVHDVAETVDALKIADAVHQKSEW